MPLDRGGSWCGRCISKRHYYMPMSHKTILGRFFRNNGFLFLQPLCIEDLRFASREPHRNTYAHKKSIIVRLFWEPPRQTFQETNIAKKNKTNNQHPPANRSGCRTKRSAKGIRSFFSYGSFLSFFWPSCHLCRHFCCQTPFAGLFCGRLNQACPQHWGVRLEIGSVVEGDVRRQCAEDTVVGTTKIYKTFVWSWNSCQGDVLNHTLMEARAPRWNYWASTPEQDGICEMPRLSTTTYQGGESCGVGSWSGLSGFHEMESRRTALPVWNHRK